MSSAVRARASKLTSFSGAARFPRATPRLISALLQCPPLARRALAQTARPGTGAFPSHSLQYGSGPRRQGFAAPLRALDRSGPPPPDPYSEGKPPRKAVQ